MATVPYLFALPDPDVMPARTLRNGVSALAVNAESTADALAFAKAQYGDDLDSTWDAATLTQVVADSNLSGWKFRLKVVGAFADGVSPAPVVDYTVTAAEQTEITVAAIAATALLTSTQNYLGETAASKALVSSADYGNTETVTIDGKVYTFVTVIGVTEGNVLRGGGETATMANLVSAMMHTGGTPGVNYVTAAVHPTVSAVSDGVHTVTMTAKTAGTAGNSIAISETCATAAFTGGATALSGGVNSETVTINGKVYTFQNTLTNVDGHVLKGVNEAASILNLHHAINNSGGSSGTDYAAATTAHPTVTAADNGTHVLTITAITAGAAGNALTTTETAANASWSDVTMGTGAGATLGVDATTTSDKISSLAELMVAALNASGTIDGAAFNPSTHVLTVADAGDVLGDHRIVAAFIHPSADPNLMIGVPGFIVSKVDAGASSDTLTITFPADTYTPTTLFATLGDPA